MYSSRNEKERKERRIENGVYFADSDGAVFTRSVMAKTDCVMRNSTIRGAFQMYDVFPRCNQRDIESR